MNLNGMRRQIEKLQELIDIKRPIDPGAVPDPVAWARAVSGIELDPWQEDLIANPRQRELLLCSRQTGKTESVALKAAYNLVYTHRPSILVIAPTLRQSRNLFERIESAVMRSNPCPPIDWINRTGMRLKSGGVVRALPGDKPDLVRGLVATSVLIDEACFVRDDILAVVLPMLTTTHGSLTLLSTPSGPEGEFYRAWTGGEDWHRVRVLATDCERISREFLAEARRKLGDLAYRQEYGCEFLQARSAFFSADLIRQAFDNETSDFEQDDAPYIR